MKNIGFIVLGLLLASNAFAVSVSVLHGDNFRNDQGYRKTRKTLTIENFSVWSYGTVFFYYDITEPMGNDAGPSGFASNGKQSKYYSNQFFGGIATTFSLSKLTGHSMAHGMLRDVSLRYEIENGSGIGNFNFRNYFYGLQYDLAIPGLDFFSFNTVLRDNPRAHGVGQQFGMFWQKTWEWSNLNRLKFTGFLATSPFDGNNPEKLNFRGDAKGRYLTTQPQLLYDLGYHIHGTKDKLEIGAEYGYFLNRFQARNKDEKVLQALLKMSF